MITQEMSGHTVKKYSHDAIADNEDEGDDDDDDDLDDLDDHDDDGDK